MEPVHQPDWIAAYFDALFARRRSGRPVNQRPCTFRDGSRPERNKCHPNAERYAAENPGCKGQNWNVFSIKGSTWHACSFNDVPATLPWAEILANHLRALR